MAGYTQNSERLEVTDAGFSNNLWSTEMHYWKDDKGPNFIYGLVFRLELWIVFVSTLFISSIIFFITSYI